MDRLVKAGYRVRDAEAGWKQFAELRSKYASPLNQMAHWAGRWNRAAEAFNRAMVRARNLAMAPLWLLVVAAVVLLALLVQARPVAAPVRTLLPGTSAAVTAAPVSNPVSQRPISVSKPAAPAPPVPGSQPAAPASPQAPGSASCPSQPGSGLPCSQP